MKHFFTSLAVAASFFVNAQVTLTKDNSFGTNGTAHFQLVAEANFGVITDTQDNKLMLFGQDVPETISVHKNKIFKIELNGTADTSFGANGLLVLPDYKGSFNVIKQGTDKFLVVFDAINSNYHPTSPYNDEKAILRYNLNGTLDTTFATNGELRIAYQGGEAFLGSNIAVLPDNSILFADTAKYMKFTVNGQLDAAYASTGTSAIANSGNLKNIGTNIYNFYDDKVVMTDIVGNTNTSFGTSGTFSYPNTGDFNPILYSNNTFGVLDFNSNRYYNISATGTLMNNISLPTSNVDYYSGHTMLGGTYFMGGSTNAGLPFIIAYNSTGTLQTINGAVTYLESLSSASELNSLFSKDNNLYAVIDTAENGQHSYTITKYIVKQNLATTEAIKENGFVIENPVRGTLNFASKEKVAKVELYSTDGRLARTVSASGAQVADLQRGLYVAKVYFQNGSTTTAKIVKQ